MPTHKKFSDSSDEDNTSKKHDEKEKHRSKDVGKDEEKTHSSSASRDRDREKRKEHESRKNRDEPRRHEEKKRDRSRERHDEPRKNRDRDARDDDRRAHQNRSRDASREDRNRRDDRRDNNWKHRDRPRRQREEEEPTDGPAWATNRVKEHAEKLKERKLIWQGKKDGEAEQAEEGESSSVDQQATKNMGMWSSAIAATGVDDKQAEKFKRLLGFKGAASQQAPQTSSADVSVEREKQKNMLKSLDKQFAIARETTHTGRGFGLGFH